MYGIAHVTKIKLLFSVSNVPSKHKFVKKSSQEIILLHFLKVQEVKYLNKYVKFHCQQVG